MYQRYICGCCGYGNLLMAINNPQDDGRFVTYDLGFVRKLKQFLNSKELQVTSMSKDKLNPPFIVRSPKLIQQLTDELGDLNFPEHTQKENSDRLHEALRKVGVHHYPNEGRVHSIQRLGIIAETGYGNYIEIVDHQDHPSDLKILSALGDHLGVVGYSVIIASEYDDYDDTHEYCEHTCNKLVGLGFNWIEECNNYNTGNDLRYYFFGPSVKGGLVVKD